MENDIRNHKFFEYGEHKGHIYGTTLDSIREVINDGKMCVLDCSPAVSLSFVYLVPFLYKEFLLLVLEL